jgi:hypothetical protein
MEIISSTNTNKNYKYYLNFTANAPFPKIILKNIIKEIEKSYLLFTFKKLFWI